MKNAWVVLLSVAFAGPLGGCAPSPVNAVDPYRNAYSGGVYDPRNNAIQRERRLNGAGLNWPATERTNADRAGGVR
jgi:hypothetical protein